MNGAIDYTRLFIVVNDTLVTAAGVPVAMKALLGGAHYNITAPSQIRWFPSIAGIQAASALGVSSGGTDGLVRRGYLYENIGQQTVARDLFLAKASGPFPVLVLAWVDSPALGQKGTGTAKMADNWMFYVVTTRHDAHDPRSAEGGFILDRLTELFEDRARFDGLPLSQPGVNVRGRGRLAVGPTSYVYTFSFTTYRSVKRDDSEPPIVSVPWTKTNYDGLSEDKKIIDDLEIEMTTP